MAQQNGKVPGTFVSNQELKDLGELLTTMRTYIVSHEARLEALEEFANEVWKALYPQPEAETDGTEEAPTEEAATLSLVEPVDESSDDSSEG